MANEKRLRSLAIGGWIEDNPLTNVATTLTSAALAALPAVGSTEHAVIVLDPDGKFGAPEIAYVTAHTAAAVSATLVRGQEGTTARQHDRDVPWIHGSTPLDYYGSPGGMGLIAVVQHTPAGAIVVTTSTAGGIDVDATNLAVSFVAPPSGKVLHRWAATAYQAGAAGWGYWILRTTGGSVAGSEEGIAHATNGIARHHYTFLETGLTPGTTYARRWGARVAAGGQLYHETMPMTMEVWAVNA